MNRKISGLAGAVGLAAVGTLVLVGYVQAAEDRALAGERLVPVLVVAAPAEKGTPADEVAVRTEEVPVKVKASGAVTAMDDLDGMAAAVDLLPGEQVLASRFAPAEEVGGAGIPDGLEQVTISLDAQRAVGGRISAGSTVGVFASFGADDTGRTELVLHEVPVVTVTPADPATAEEGAAPGTVLVTLAVEPANVLPIVFGAEHGRLWLSGIDGIGEQEEAEDL